MNMDLTVIVTSCAAITTVSAASAVVYKIFSKSIKKIAGETIKEEVDRVFGLYDTQLSEINKKLNDLRDELDRSTGQTREAFLSLIRERINQIHQEYVPKGWIGAHTLFIVEELYKMYKALGGNSFIDRHMEDIRALEVRSAEDMSHN